MSDFPHWPTRPTGDVFYVKGRIGWRNLRRSDFCEDGPHLITGMHIDESGRVDWSSCFHIPKRKFDESPEIQVKVGDLVITKDGTIGKVARIDWLPGDTSLNSHLFLVRPIHPELCSARFAFYIFTSAAFRNFIESQKSGSTLAGLGESKFVRFEFPLPTLVEQELVSSVLDTLDTAIRETEALIDKLKALKQGLLHDLLTRGIDPNGQLRPPQSEAPHLYKESPLGWIPRAWSWGTLGAWLAGKPKNGYSPKEAGGWTGIQMLGLGCLATEGFRPIQLKPAPAEDKGLGKALLSDGDLLISRANTRELVGLVGVYRDVGTPCTYPDLMMRLTPSPETSAEFLQLILQSNPVRRQIQAAASGTSESMVKISAPIVTGLKIAIPEIEEQKVILCRAKALDAQLQNELEGVKGLRALKSGLMDDLLTGRVRVAPLLKSLQQTAAHTGA